MLSALRKRMSYANVVATLALFFALSGGAAYAASHYLITSTKQIKPSVLAQLKGKAGHAGANGAQGPAGPEGKAGANGSGSPGSPGAPGAPGKSVVAAAEGKGVNCKEGGSSFEVEGSAKKTYACGGKEGSPWTAGGTLPHNSTETGVWSVEGNANGIVQEALASFPIQLSSNLEASGVHFINSSGKEVLQSEEKEPASCHGSAAEPTADPGNLCIYSAGVTGTIEIFDESLTNPTTGNQGASKAGVIALMVASLGSTGTGTWAVTD